MRLLPGGILTAHARRKTVREAKRPQLRPHAITASTGYDAQCKTLRERANYASRPRQQPRPLGKIRRAPQAIRLGPTRPRHLRGSIYLIPVRGVAAFELVEPPSDFERAKHREVGTRIGGIGIEQRPVPIQQDDARTKSLSAHSRESYQKRAGSEPPPQGEQNQ